MREKGKVLSESLIKSRLRVRREKKLETKNAVVLWWKVAFRKPTDETIWDRGPIGRLICTVVAAPAACYCLVARSRLPYSAVLHALSAEVPYVWYWV